MLPPVRGPWTASLYGLLAADQDAVLDPVIPAGQSDVAVLDDDDLQMALYLCYELHYTDIAGVAGRKWKWIPLVLMFRAGTGGSVRTRPAGLFAGITGGRLAPQLARNCSGWCERIRDRRSRGTCRRRRRWISFAST